MNKEEVRELIGDSNWREFLDYMHGKTVGVNDDGSTDFYDWNVERFIMSLKRRGKL